MRKYTIVHDIELNRYDDNFIYTAEFQIPYRLTISYQIKANRKRKTNLISRIPA